MALGGTLTSDEICLVIAIKMYLVSVAAELLAFLELLDDIRVAGRREKALRFKSGGVCADITHLKAR